MKAWDGKVCGVWCVGECVWVDGGVWCGGKEREKGGVGVTIHPAPNTEGRTTSNEETTCRIRRNEEGGEGGGVRWTFSFLSHTARCSPINFVQVVKFGP